MRLSLVIPTYNESENIPKLIEKVIGILEMDYELIIVDDDSPDLTWEIAEKLSKNHKNVKVIRREGERGLSSAVLYGWEHSTGNVYGVMDADLSHPPEIIPHLFNMIESGKDIAVASRYVKGGGIEDWPFFRKFISKSAGMLSRGLTDVKDPMSGFFLVKKKVVHGREINPIGFKILLEILSKGMYDKEKVAEIPFIFKNRKMGTSKLGSSTIIDYLKQLTRLYLNR